MAVQTVTVTSFTQIWSSTNHSKWDLLGLTGALCAAQESEDAVKTLAKEKDMLEREKWDLRRQSKEATEQASILRSQLDMKENRIKELEAELTMVSHPAYGRSRTSLN